MVGGCSDDKPTDYTGDISITSEASLKSYPDLTELRKVIGNLSINLNTYPGRFEELQNLEEVTGDVDISGDYSFRKQVLPNIKTVGGNCTLGLGLSSYLDFSRLETIGGKLLVYRGFYRDREKDGYNFSNLKSVKEIRIGTIVKNFTFSPDLKELDVFYIREFPKNVVGLTGLEHVHDSLYIRGLIDGGAEGSFSNLKTVGNSMNIRLNSDSKTAFQWLTKLESCPSIKLDYYYLYPYDLCGLKPFILNNPDTEYLFSSTTYNYFEEQDVLNACQ